MMKQIYFMPGMAASELIFENIQLPENQFTTHYMKWVIPHKKESLKDYVSRLIVQIEHDRPVLIGVSFGGIIVQEIAKQIEVERVIIISSVKSNIEFPRRMRFSKSTGFHKILPTSLVVQLETLLKYSFGIATKRLELYKKYLSVNDKRYLDWALDTIVNWDQDNHHPEVIHIHGDSDPVFPIKYIENCITIEKGTHIMIINRYKWFNENLPHIILE